MRYVLILADTSDTVALAVAAALQRGAVPTLALAPMELSLGCQWIYRMVNGRTQSELRVRDLVLTERDIGAVFNRLAAPQFFPSGAWARPGDADYAETEFAALATSWLSELPHLVIGRPTEGVLWVERRLFEWLALGAAAGFPVRRVEESTDARTPRARGRVAYDPIHPSGSLAPVDLRVAGRHPVLLADCVADCRRAFLVGTDVIGAPDARLVPAVRRLGQLTDTALLECHLGRRGAPPGEWVLCGATAFPSDVPPVVIRAIAEALGGAASVPS